MKKFILFILNIILVMSLSAKDFERTEKIDNIKNLYINGSALIKIQKGNKDSLEIIGNEEIVKEIKVNEKDGKLEIVMPKKTYVSFTDKIEINIDLKTIESLEFDGAGDVGIKNFKLDKFLLKIDGTGDVVLEKMNFDEFSLDINGSGSVEVEGKTETLKVLLAGVGNFKAYKLESQKAEVILNGTGKMEINAQKELKASLNGVGKITYKGDPKVQKMSINGLGSIKKLDE